MKQEPEIGKIYIFNNPGHEISHKKVFIYAEREYSFGGLKAYTGRLLNETEETGNRIFTKRYLIPLVGEEAVYLTCLENMR